MPRARKSLEPIRTFFHCPRHLVRARPEAVSSKYAILPVASFLHPSSGEMSLFLFLGALGLVLAAAAGFYAGVLRSRRQVQRLDNKLLDSTLQRQEAESRAERAETQARQAKEEAHGTTVQLEAYRKEVERLTSVDELSGLLNRRRFDECLKDEWRRMYRSKTPLAMILADVDHFSLFNENYGRKKGDECLQLLADYLKAAFNRVGDILARYDGDEFAVILTDTDASEALRQAERLRSGVKAMRIAHERAQADAIITVSLGLVSIDPGVVIDMEDALGAAEEALRKAQTEGGDRIWQVRDDFHARQV